MGNIEFYECMIKNWDIYIYSFFLCLFLYYVTFKRVFISLLDPLNFNLLYSFLGASVVVFLFFIGEINMYYFSSYCFTQIAFTAAFFIFKPINVNDNIGYFAKEFKIKDEKLLLQLIFIISSLLNVVCQLYVYSVRGIPLFMESYLETYNVGGGFGSFSRIINTTSMVSWYFLIHFYLNKTAKNLRLYMWVYMLLSLAFFSLSGSKGTFLTIGLVLALYTLINSRYNMLVKSARKKVEKLSLRLFIFICIMIIFIISIKDSTGTNPLLTLAIRLIHSGDAYFYGYPNAVITSLDKGSTLNAIFADILGMFRIVPWESLPPPFGQLLFRYHYPLIDVVAGANGRHNIFGLFYFGYIGSIVYSFLLGFILSFLRNYLYYHLPRNILFGLFYTLLYFVAITLEADITLALFMFDSYLLSLILVFLLCLFFYGLKNSPKLAANNG